MRTRFGKDVLELLNRGEPVRDADVVEPLDLRLLCDGDALHVPIRLAGCRLAGLSGACVQFHAPVVLENCTIEAAEGSFFAAYFLAGLRVSGCTFRSPLDLQCGGHNQGGSEVVLTDSIFKGFVNFFDCWFEGPVMIRRCRFEGGANLLGNKGQPCEVRFDLPPVIEDNVGALDLDGG